MEDSKKKIIDISKIKIGGILAMILAWIFVIFWGLDWRIALLFTILGINL